MEESFNQLEHLFLVAVDFGSQSLVVVGTETLDDTVNHGGAEHVVLLEDGTLLFQAIS